MSPHSSPTLQVHEGIAVWSAGHPSATTDIWFLPALADSHLCFRNVFSHPICQRASISV
jgi:hypothetical protein